MIATRAYPHPAAFRRAVARWGALWARWDRTEVALTAMALGVLALAVWG